MKTVTEIRDEVKALTEIKPFIPHFTLFNDDNWQAIDRQIEALVDEWTEDDAWDLNESGDLNEHDFSAVREAIDWVDDCYEPYDEDGYVIDRPSMSWKSLAGML
jgi:hypothetical protein